MKLVAAISDQRAHAQSMKPVSRPFLILSPFLYIFKKNCNNRVAAILGVVQRKGKRKKSARLTMPLLNSIFNFSNKMSKIFNEFNDNMKVYGIF